VVKLWFDLAMGLISYRIASPIQWDSPQHEIDDRGPGRPRLHRQRGLRAGQDARRSRRRCGDTPLFVGALFDNLRDWRAFDVLVILPNSQKASFDRTGFPAR
jgi:hypothetical protein